MGATVAHEYTLIVFLIERSIYPRLHRFPSGKTAENPTTVEKDDQLEVGAILEEMLPDAGR